MKQLILVGNQKVKFQDTETTISLTLVSDGNTVTIDKNKTYSIKIKNGTGYVKAIDATPDTTNNMVTFSTSGLDGLPVDAYFIELWVIDNNGQTIYPSDSFIEVDITANATGVEGQVLPAITMQEFEERFSTLQSNLETKVGTLIGPTGNGISTVVTEYQLSASGSNVPTGTWSKSPVPQTDDLPYLWARTTTTYTDKSTHVSYNISAKGTKGNNFTIQGSTSSIAGLPSVGTDGEGYMVGTELYVWTNGKWNDIVNMKGVQGDKGIQGIQGIKGDTGTGISSITTEYELSKQGTAVPSTGWSSTLLTMTNDLPYLWTRVTITFTNGSKNMVYFTSNKGDKGDTGEKGDKGDTGANLAVKGAVDKNTQLPSSGNSEGDAYLVGTNLYVYTSNAWKNCGPIIAENTVLYNADGSLNVNGTNYNYVQDLRNGKIQYNDGTKNIELTPVDSQQEAKDILSARNYTDSSISSLSNSINTKLSGYATNSQLAAKADDSKVVHDNHDGTEQLNGVQVQPFNKLSDTVGGRNLFLNSKEITEGYGTIGDTKVTVEPFDSATNMWHIVAKQGGSGVHGLYSYNYVQDRLPDTSDWSCSLDVKGIGKIAYIGMENSSRNPVSGTVGSEWSRISQTGHIDNVAGKKAIIIYFYANDSPLDVYIKLPKFELGNMPTDWTPAPEDKVNVSDMRKPASDVAGIEEVNAKQDKIGYAPANDSKVVHDNHDGTEQLNGVQVQPYNKLSDTIGGRNLLPGTSGTLQTVTDASGWNNNLPIIKQVLTTIDSDATYTVRAWISPASHDANIQIAWKDAQGVKQDGGNVISAGTSGYSTWKGTITAGSTINYVTIAFREFQSTPSSVSYKEMKLEKGSVATDWTPAPEDKVNVSDMRKPASDVVGIEEVNAKQDKIGYTPADDSKVVHTTDMRKPANDVAGIEEVNAVDAKSLARNLISNSGYMVNLDGWQGTNGGNIALSTHSFYHNGTGNVIKLYNTQTGEVFAKSDWFKVKPNTQYTFQFILFGTINTSSTDVWLIGQGTNATSIINGYVQSPIKAELITKTFTTGNFEDAYIRVDNNGSKDGNSSYLAFTEVQLEEGTVAHPWTPSFSDLVHRVADNGDGSIRVNGNSYTPADDSTVLHNNALNQILTDNSGIIIGNDKDFGFIKRQNYKGGLAIGSGNSFHFMATSDTALSNTSQYHDVWRIGSDGKVSILGGASFTPSDDSKVAHLSGANNFDTVPTVNNTPLLTSDKLPDNIVKQGDVIGNINYVMYLASYPTTVGQLVVVDGTVDSTKTKFITTTNSYPIPPNVTSMIWETPQINMPLLVGNVIAFYDTSGKFISANAYDATTSYQLINIPKNAYSFKISCGSNSLNGVKLFSGSSYIDSSPYPIVMGLRIKDKMAATTDDVTNAISTATANSADVSKANTFSKQQVFSTNPTNGTQVYPIYATVGTDADATTLIASLQSSGFSGMVGVPES